MLTQAITVTHDSHRTEKLEIFTLRKSIDPCMAAGGGHSIKLQHVYPAKHSKPIASLAASG